MQSLTLNKKTSDFSEVFLRIGKFKYAKALNFLVRISATKAIACVILHLDYVELSPCSDAIVVLEGGALRLGASQVFFTKSKNHI
jgi:hypothetical protein